MILRPVGPGIQDLETGDVFATSGSTTKQKGQLVSVVYSAAIGVASYGALWHLRLDFQLFNFSGHFIAAQTLTFDSMRFQKE